MNRNLTVKYQILLASNLQKEAAKQTQILENANARQQKSFDKTSQAASKMGQKIGSTGRDVENAARGFDRTAQAIQRVDAAMSRNGFGRSSLERTIRYLRSIQLDLDKVTQKAIAAGNGIQKATAIGVGVAAAGAAGVAMAKRPVEFDTKLANLANTAYSDRDTAGRRVGMKELEVVINKAVESGGTRDQAADALSSIISSGVVSLPDAMQMLPSIQASAVAGDADTTDIANIAIRAMQNFGLTADQIPVALSKALRAGQEGGFELKDMAKWLPQMMGTAKGMLGMQGMPAFEKLISVAQTSVITAGTKDEAGNNLVNLLGKINSQDTAKDFASQGVDLPKSLEKAMGDGKSPIDAFGNFVEQLMMKDKNYVALRKRADNETGDERKKSLSAMADIMQGTVIGKVMQDRQSLMALIGYMQNKPYLQNVEKSVRLENGESVKANLDLLSTTTGYKAQQVANQTDIARTSAFNTVETPINAGLDWISGYSKDHPITSQAAMLAGAGYGMAGAARIGSGLYGVLNGSVAGATATGIMRGTGSSMARGLPWLGAGLAAVDVGETILDDKKSGAEKFNDVGRTASSVAGAWAGAKLGAAAGAFTGPFAPIASPLLGLAGGAAGYFAAPWLGDKLSEWTGPKKAADGLQQSQKVELDIKDGRLLVDVSVKDDRVQTRTSVVQQLSNINIDAGSTNPGGYQ